MSPREFMKMEEKTHFKAATSIFMRDISKTIMQIEDLFYSLACLTRLSASNLQDKRSNSVKNKRVQFLEKKNEKDILSQSISGAITEENSPREPHQQATIDGLPTNLTFYIYFIKILNFTFSRAKLWSEYLQLLKYGEKRFTIVQYPKKKAYQNSS